LPQELPCTQILPLSSPRKECKYFVLCHPKSENSASHIKASVSIARARHEAVNSLFKKYGILERHFRHHRSLHGRVFTAIANIIQLTIMKQGPVFPVDYSDGMEA
jgi:hypothetical protein